MLHCLQQSHILYKITICKHKLYIMITYLFFAHNLRWVLWLETHLFIKLQRLNLQEKCGQGVWSDTASAFCLAYASNKTSPTPHKDLILAGANRETHDFYGGEK